METVMDTTPAVPLLQVRNCRQSYHKDSHTDLLVLDDVNLTLNEGEIVALLGRSGSGKSTLLRIVSGLLQPTAGEVIWHGRKVEGPAPGMAMVFQSFALFPWLTVQENVELGLEAQGVPHAERAKRAEAAIDLIGLDGYESAYPKELSGGMRQRVGLARALVVHPDLLLMDEPFSALDVLTAETLRTDLIDLWSEGKLPVKSVLIVTHNIEEAVLMCDRILVFSSSPGRVANELRVPFPHPRNRLDPAFRQMVDDIYALMTRRAPAPTIYPTAVPLADPAFTTPLHPVSTNLLAGLIEALAAPPYEGRADLPALATTLQLEADELLPLGETMQLLGLGVLEEGDLPTRAASSPTPTPTRASASSRKPCVRASPWLLQSAVRWTNAGTTAPPPCASATSWRITCLLIMPRRRCAPRSPGAAMPSCSATTRKRSSSIWRRPKRRRDRPWVTGACESPTH
jgi:NitT/TauT family transport system ATP-binding protein